MEDHFNARLPQFRCRTLIVPTPTLATSGEAKMGMAGSTTTSVYRNLHFVHRKSTSSNAIPLLVIPTFGSSFLEVARVIEFLTEPITTPTPQTISLPQPQAFHVVCASLPGFGFSGAASDKSFGPQASADVLAALMTALGHDRFIITADASAFLVARALALQHPSRCIAIHTANLSVPPPSLLHTPWTWLRYHIARLTNARLPHLSFGYIPTDFSLPHHGDQNNTNRASASELLKSQHRLQTHLYALSDSPTGLLALIVDLIGLSSLESLRYGMTDTSSDGRIQLPSASVQHAWSPSEIILWTMMYWLPGPEAPLRWLQNTVPHAVPRGPLWRTMSRVPLGISVFGGGGDGVGDGGRGTGKTPPAWATAYHNVRWVRRHTRSTGLSAIWEAPMEFVVDLREFAGAVVS